MLNEVRRKIKREALRVNEYGPAYAVRHIYWRQKYKQDPKRHIYYDEWRRLNALTKRKVNNEKERYKERGEAAPHFLVAVDTLGRTPEELTRTKRSLAHQTWLPDKVFTGRTAYLMERMQEYLSDKDKDNYWILRMQAGDELERDFFYQIAKKCKEDPGKNVWYTDREIWIGDTPKEDEHNVCLSPDFSVEYFCAYDHIGKAFVARSSLYGEGLVELAVSSCLFLLKCVEAESRKGNVSHDCFIGHVPRLLYNERQKDEKQADEKANNAQIDELIKKIYYNVNKASEFNLKNVSVLPGPSGTRSVKLTWDEKPSVTVIIPNKDHIEDLAVCLGSLQKQTIRDRLEILIVENNSEWGETFDYYEWLTTGKTSDRIPKKLIDEELRNDLNVKVLYWSSEFNYSAINNFAAENAAGDYLLLLNNDVELIGADAIEWLLSSGMQKNVGMVGAKLYYEDETVQHAGVIVGFGGVGGHAFTGLPMGDGGYMKQADCARRLCAVTAACLLVKREAYEKVSGLDTGFAVAFNDVDFCLRVYEEGYSIIYQPSCEGWHAESKSRGDDLEGEKLRRFQGEIALFLAKWQGFLAKGDPYYNPNFSLEHKDFVSYREPYPFDDQF